MGVSNFEILHLKLLTDEDGLPQPAVNQLQFHPHLQRRELKKYCEEKGIFFQASIGFKEEAQVQAYTSLARNDPRLLEETKLVIIAKTKGFTVQVRFLREQERSSSASSAGLWSPQEGGNLAEDGDAESSRREPKSRPGHPNGRRLGRVGQPREWNLVHP